MRQRNKGRICVYQDKRRRNWRVEITSTDGKRVTHTVATEELANIIAAHARAQMQSAMQTVQEAIDMYLDELRARESAESHIVSTRARLRLMFPAREEQYLSELHPVTCQRLYEAMRKRKSPRTGKLYAVDTHRHALLQSRAMCKWLITKGALKTNPFADVEGVGRRKKGKTQLTIDEARRFVDVCLAEPGPRATAALCCLLLAMRAGEIVGLTPRSIDDDGRLVRVFEAKTDAGVRLIELPELLRERMPELAATEMTRHMISCSVRRLCRAAGVTVVNPHALRGTHASLATRAGATSQLVADSLGHASTDVTHRHYTKADAVADARVGLALTVLAGGKG